MEGGHNKTTPNAFLRRKKLQYMHALFLAGIKSEAEIKQTDIYNID